MCTEFILRFSIDDYLYFCVFLHIKSKSIISSVTYGYILYVKVAVYSLVEQSKMV